MRQRDGWILGLLAATWAGGCGRKTRPNEAPPPTEQVQALLDVAIGASSACAVLGTGAVQCWGDNGYGQLGDGTRVMHLVPQPVVGLAQAVEVDVGDVHACARTRSGEVWCWGGGSDGAIGNNARTNAPLPVKVAGLPPVRDLGTSGGNTCAVALDGGVWCWGSNVFGESAQPAGVREVLVPTRVAGLGAAVEVDTGQNHTCARLQDGTVWCWGGAGPLGDGAYTQRHAPVQVSGLAGATALAVGQNHNCARVAGGAVQCWGSTGGRGGGRVATAVPGLAGVTDLRAGNYSTCATLPTGQSHCWGTNYQGKFLVPATQRSVDAPTALPGLSGQRAVALGIHYQCAVMRDDLRCWGSLKQGFGSRSALRTETVYPVTFDGRSPPPPHVPDPTGQGGSVAAAAREVVNAAGAARQAVAAAQGAVPDAGAGAPVETLEARIARSSPVEAHPQEVTLDGHTVRATRCVLDGPALVAASSASVLPSIAVDRRGTLHLVDADGRVRRYTRVRGDDCRFAVDPSFGEAGVLALPQRVTTVAVDRRGNAVASGVLGSFVIEDGQVTTRCNRGPHGNVALAPSGEGFGIFPGAPVRRVTYDNGGCEVAEWAYERPFSSVMAIAFDRRNILLAGAMPTGGGNQVAILDAQGRERVRFGNARGTADDGFCWVHGLAACGPGVCAVDTNCDRLRVWSARGEHLGNARASELLGVPRPWLYALTAGRRGELYVAAGVRREPAAANVSEGVIFRVEGL